MSDQTYPEDPAADLVQQLRGNSKPSRSSEPAQDDPAAELVLSLRSKQQKQPAEAPKERKPMTLGDRAAGQDWAWGKVKQGARALGEAVGITSTPESQPPAARSIVKPAATAGAQPQRQPAPYRDRREALDDAVNLVEEGADIGQVSQSMARLGIQRAEIEQHGQQRGSAIFQQQRLTPAEVDAAQRARGAQPAGSIQASPAPRDRTLGEAVTDTGLQLKSGTYNIAGAVPQLVAPEGETAQFFQDRARQTDRAQSGPMRDRMAIADVAISEAGQDGITAQMAEAASQYFNDPALAARFVITNLPSMVPGLAATKLAQVATLARGMTAAKAARNATLAAGAVNATLNAGGARGEAFDDIKRTLMAQGMSEQEATDTALRDSRVVAAIGGIAGALSGASGLEGAVAKSGTAAARGGLVQGLKSAGTELLGEQVEEVAPKLATNAMAGQYDGRDVTQDVGRTIVETAIGSAPGAAVAGVSESAGDPNREIAGEINRSVPDVMPQAPMQRDPMQAWEIARSKGFLVDAPLPTDKPSVRRSKAVEMFKELGAMFGIAQPLQDLAIKHSEGKPGDKLPAFFAKYAQALQNRGLVGQSLDPDVLEAMQVAPVTQAQPTTVEQPAEQDAPQAFQNQPAPGQMAANLEQTQPTDAIAPVPQGSLADQVAAVTGLAEDVSPAPSAGISTAVDAAAHQAATSPTNDLPEPTQAMKEAGNYKVGRTRIAGLDIRIENPQGSKRRGTAPDGTPWETEMRAHYGYVAGTEANDGDKLDVFIKAGTDEDWRGPVFVIDQVDPKTGGLDEHKVVMGAADEAEAEALYRSNYDADWQGFGAITRLPLPVFKAWAKSGRLNEPLGDIASRPQLAPDRKPADVSPTASMEQQRNEPKPPQAQPTPTAPEAAQAPVDPGGPGQAGAGEKRGGVSGAGSAIPQAGGVGAKPKARKHPPAVRGSGALADVSRALGGISPDLLADLSEKVVRNRASKSGKKTQYTAWDNPAIPGVGPLFRKGGTADLSEVARVLEESGYLEAGAVENDPVGAAQRAQEIIKAELRQGGSTLQVGDADAIESEMRSRQEAAMDEMGDPWDDFTFTPDDLEESGYAWLDQDLQLEVERLIAEADQVGLDTEIIREDIAKQVGAEASQDDYNTIVKEAIQGLLARARQEAEQTQPSRPQQGGRDGIEAAGDQSAEGSRSQGRQGGSDQEGLSLTAPTRADIEAQQDRAEQAGALDEKAQAKRESEVGDSTFMTGFTGDGRQDNTADLFSPQADPGAARGDEVGGSRPKPSANTIFTEDAAAAARARLKAKLGRTQSGIDPEMLMDGLTLAGYHIEKGARTFAAFARAMVDDLGEGAKPYLKSWYMGVKYDPRAATFDGMSSAADVESTSLDDIADNAAKKDKDHVPSARPDLEPDRQDPAGSERALAQPDGNEPGQADTGAGKAGGRSGAQRSGRAGDSGVRAGGATASGERGDQPVRGDASKSGSSLVPAGVDIDQRGGGFGDRGIPVETVSADATRGASQDGLAQGLSNKAQRTAPTAVKLADLDNIRETLPLLLPGQQEDVQKAETRFAKPDGYGMLFTNGTGTGKTFTGLGVVKRFAMQGKTSTIMVVPSDKIMEDWISSGKRLGLDITPLANTKDAGKGIVITTYANFGDNRVLGDREWDLVVHDEAHYLMQAEDGKPTAALATLRAITKHPDGAYTLHSMRNRVDVDRLKAINEELKMVSAIAGNDGSMDADHQAARKRQEVLERERDKLNTKVNAAQDAIKQEVADAQGASRPRAVFLSATPFAYVPTVDWANGYLMEYDEGRGDESNTFRGYNEGSNREQFFMQHFGMRMRYNKLTKPDAKVNTSLMERQFNTWLRTSGALSGRMLDVHADYDRRFVLVESAIGLRIDEALNWVYDQARGDKEAGREPHRGFDTLGDVLRKKFDYLSRRYLLEAIKAQESIAHVKAHMAMGRKVVVFHDYKKGGGFNPFDIQTMSEGGDETVSPERVALANEAIGMFRREFSDLVRYPFAAMPSPIEAYQKAFPDVLLFNGDVKPADRRANVAKFQDDAAGPAVILVQSAAGKEGISLHDTTGKHQRALLNLGQPTQPTTAIQQEGRIYRTGQKSDAIFRYFNTGTNWEKWAFATTISTRSSTAENLGMGELARALKDAFIAAFEESDSYPAGHEGEGKGGKERDKAANEALTEFDRAVSFYYGTQKKNSKTKAQEGADYFATPEPLGLKMVEWLDAHAGDHLLEPSGGHGAIARWMPENTERTVIEPSSALRPRLAMVFDGKIIGSDFEDMHVSNKFDGIVMNPPFGVGGKLAIEHLAKAATHLRDGGRIVALIPTGPAADKRFDKWFYEEEQRPLKPLLDHPKLGPVFAGDTVKTRVSFVPSGVIARRDKDGSFWIKTGRGSETMVSPDAWTAVESTGKRTQTYRPAEGLHLAADIKLPQVTFERAGTSVATRIVVIEKAIEGHQAPQQRNRDWTDIADINDFFTRIRDADLPKRAKPVPAEGEASADPGADVVKAVKQDDRKAAKTQKAEQAQQGTALAEGQGWPIIEHTTGKGKVLKGVVRKDLSQAQAKEFDAYTFKKDGGWFIRAEHVPKMVEGGGPVANEPSASYSAREQTALFDTTTPKGRLGYETDLFGNPLPANTGRLAPTRSAGASVRGNAQSAAGVQDTEAPAGRYRVRTIVGTEASRKLGVGVIKTPQQAAQATAYLYRSAVERFDAIVTDADGKPLGVVGGFKGAITQTSVYPSTILAEAVRIPGAANIWFSHNHPSGKEELSRADEALNKVLATSFEGSGIKPMGTLAVAGDRYGFASADASDFHTGSIPTPVGSITVPVIEREMVSDARADGFPVLDAPYKAKEAAKAFYDEAGEPGLMMLDAQLRVAAWVPITSNMMGQLKSTGGLAALYRAISESNANSVIIAHGGELSARRGDGSAWTIAQNIGAAAGGMDVRVLDIIDTKAGRSATEVGENLRAGSVFSVESGSAGVPGILGIGAKPSAVLGVDRPTISRVDLDELIVGKVENWRGIGLDRIIAVDSWVQLPEQILADARKKGFHPGLIEGVVNQGRVYLVRSALRNRDHAERVLFHEGYGHIGVRIALEGRPTEALNDLWSKLNGLAGVAKLAKKRQVGDGVTAWDRLQPYVRGTQEDVTARRAQIMDELIAFLAQANDTSALTQFKTYLADLKGAMVALARRLGLDGLADNLDRAGAEMDVLQLVRDARKAVHTGASRGGSLVVYGTDPAPVFSEGERQRDEADPKYSLSPDDPDPLKRAMAKAGLRKTSGIVGRARDLIASAAANAVAMVQSRNAIGDLARQNVLDQFTGIDVAVRREIGNLPAEQDPYIAARLANGGTSSVMRGLLMHGKAKWTASGQHLEKVEGSKGLLEILQPLGDDLNDWFAWMIGNRAARLAKEGRENLFTAEEIAAMQRLDDGRKELFTKAAMQYADFKKSVLDVAQGAGLLDADARKAWDHADYIPFYRQIDERAAFSPTGRGGLAGQSSGVRTLKGGTAALNDPMENLLMNFSRLIDASLKNNALVKTIDTLGGKSDIITKIGYEMSGELVPKDQIRKMLIAEGASEHAMSVLPEAAFDGMAKMWAIQPPSDPDAIRVMRNGKPEYYRVNDPLLLKAVTSFVPIDFPGLGVARWFKRTLTHAVTSTPEFMLRNYIRDSVSSAMISRDSFKMSDSIKGIVESYAGTGASEAMMFAGASFQSGNVNAADPTATAVAMRRALRKRGLDASSVNSLMGSIIDTGLSGWEKYREAGEAIENANREAIYKAAINDGRTETSAAFEAKDLMDFNLRGSHPIYQVLADVLPFFNARVQGLYRLGRADPKRVVQYGAVMMVATLALALANSGEDWYEELPDWDKDTFWHVRVGGQHFRIPKPFELGVIFATVPERIMRFLQGQDAGKKTAERLWANVRDQLAFDLIPQVFRPALDVYSNHNAFRDSPIESEGDEGKLPHLRYSARTSDTLKTLASAAPGLTDATGASPKRIEHLIGGYFGTVGMYALGLSDMAVRALDQDGAPRPEMRMDDYPVIKAFYREDPARSTVFESDYWKVRKEIEAVHRSINQLKKDGLKDEAKELAEDHKELVAARGAIQRTSKELARMSKEQGAIYKSMVLTPEEKRRRLDNLQAKRNALTRRTMREPVVSEAAY